MRGKNKILLLCISLFIIIGGGIFLLLVTSEESGKQKNALHNFKEKTETEWQNSDLLGAYLLNDQIENIVRESRGFLLQNTAYDDLEKVSFQDVIETENYIEFYCLLGSDEGILYGQYNKKTEDLFEWTEEENVKQAEEKWKRKKSRTISTTEWKEEGKLPHEWDYTEDDPRSVTIENREGLVERIGEENTKRLEELLLEFLKEKNEFRREFILKNFTEDPDTGDCRFHLAFKTERLDKNVIKAVFDQETGACQFELAGGDE